MRFLKLPMSNFSSQELGAAIFGRGSNGTLAPLCVFCTLDSDSSGKSLGSKSLSLDQ